MPVVNVRGLKVSYEEAGDGLPIVFVPGVADTKEFFRRQISGLSQKYRVISYDLRASTKASGLSMELLAGDLAALFRALKIPTAAVCGHSFGGMVAQEFAFRFPELTSALVLISSFPKLPAASADKALSWVTPRNGSGAGSLGWLRRIFRKPEVEPDSYEWLSETTAALDHHVLEDRLQLALAYDSTEKLPAIEVPTLVVVGSKDREMMLHASQVLYESIPDVALEVIEGGDHFCAFLRHDLVNSAIDDFLARRLASIS